MREKEIKKLVLLVDDEPEVRYLYRSILKNDERISFVEAGNGQEALGLIKQHSHMFRPNDIKCVVLDMKMPLMGGAEMLECYEMSSFFKKEIPFILCSAYGVDEMKQATANARKVTILDYLPKPVDIKRLRSLVRVATGLESIKRQIG